VVLVLVLVLKDIFQVLGLVLGGQVLVLGGSGPGGPCPGPWGQVLVLVLVLVLGGQVLVNIPDSFLTIQLKLKRNTNFP